MHSVDKLYTLFYDNDAGWGRAASCAHTGAFYSLSAYIYDVGRCTSFMLTMKEDSFYLLADLEDYLSVDDLGSDLVISLEKYISENLPGEGAEELCINIASYFGKTQTWRQNKQNCCLGSFQIPHIFLIYYGSDRASDYRCVRPALGLEKERILDPKSAWKHVEKVFEFDMLHHPERFSY